MDYDSFFRQAVNQISLPQACNFIKKETLAKVFSCEFFLLRTPFLQNTSGQPLLNFAKFTGQEHLLNRTPRVMTAYAFR